MVATYSLISSGINLANFSTPMFTSAAAQSPKILWGIHNEVGSGKVIKVYRSWMVNSSGSAAITGVYASLQLERTTGVSGVTQAGLASTAGMSSLPTPGGGGFVPALIAHDFSNAAISYGPSQPSSIRFFNGALTTAIAMTAAALTSPVMSIATNAFALGLTPGMALFSPSLAAGTRIVSVDTSSQFTVNRLPLAAGAIAAVSVAGGANFASSTFLLTSYPATGTAASFQIASSSNFITSGLLPGMIVQGTGIGSNARIRSIDSSSQVTLTVSNAATVSGNMTFSNGFSILKTVWRSTDEITPGAITPDELSTLPVLTQIWDGGYGDTTVEPIVLREGDGLHLRLNTAANSAGAITTTFAGLVDCWVEMTIQ